MKAARIEAPDGHNAAAKAFLRDALAKGALDAVLVPMEVPAGDSYAWVLIKDASLLDKVRPLAPVMPIQGARALSSITKRGPGGLRIGAVMRPCEVEAAVELSKLDQASLDNVTLISFDCSGVVPLSDYLQDKEKAEQGFLAAQSSWAGEAVRPVCAICDRFSAGASADLHFGLLGAGHEAAFLIPVSQKGNDLLEALKIDADSDPEEWQAKVEALKEDRQQRRKTRHEELRTEVGGADNLLSAFSDCIGCHNCMRACPVCYCRQCYFDSDALRMPPDNYLSRAAKRGALRFPPDNLLFHLGRMAHMATSCVSCGTCEDACPMSIKVGQIFAMVADAAQSALEYVPGANLADPLPQTTYREEELDSVEKPYAQIYRR
jgi:formate dehydrogenase subunit beta